MLKMDDKQFEKRMALLKKSYDRLDTQLDPSKVLEQIDKEDAVHNTQPIPVKRKKASVWLVSIASVFLLGILGTSYRIQQPEEPLNSEQQIMQEKQEEQQKTYQDWVKELTEKYKHQKEEIRKELMVSLDELNAFPYIQNIENEFNGYTSNKSAERITAEMAENLQHMEDSVLEKLTTPKRLFEAIDGKRLLTFEESYKIYDLYEQPAIQLESFYSGLLEPYEHLLKKKVPSSQYPLELQIIIETANEQGMELSINDNGSYAFKANPINGAFAFEEAKYLHPDSLGYFEYSQKGYLVMDKDDVRYSLEETLEILASFERTLLADKNSGSTYYYMLRDRFEYTWAALLRGTPKHPALLADGTINKDYITLLQQVADGKHSKVVRQIAATILQELAQQQTSTTRDGLAAYDIWQALLQAKGKKAGFRNYDTFHFSYMDEAEAVRIDKLYQQYREGGKEALLNQLSPIDMVALYLYAIMVGDQALQQALVMPNTVMDTSRFNHLDSLTAISQLGESNAPHKYPLVSVRMKEDSNDKAVIIKLMKNNNGHNRIIGIAD